jgi:hypothetical protein
MEKNDRSQNAQPSDHGLPEDDLIALRQNWRRCANSVVHSHLKTRQQTQEEQFEILSYTRMRHAIKMHEGQSEILTLGLNLYGRRSVLRFRRAS